MEYMSYIDFLEAVVKAYKGYNKTDFKDLNAHMCILLGQEDYWDKESEDRELEDQLENVLDGESINHSVLKPFRKKLKKRIQKIENRYEGSFSDYLEIKFGEHVTTDGRYGRVFNKARIAFLKKEIKRQKKKYLVLI